MGQTFTCVKKIPKIEIKSDCCHNETSTSIQVCRHCGSRVRIGMPINELSNQVIQREDKKLSGKSK